MNEAVVGAKRELEGVVSYVLEMKKQADSIVNAMKEAAATVGVGHYSTRFEDVAKKYAKDSKGWLWAALGFATVAVIGAILSAIFWPLPENLREMGGRCCNT